MKIPALSLILRAALKPIVPTSRIQATAAGLKAAWEAGVQTAIDLLEDRAAVATSDIARTEALGAAATLRVMYDCGPGA